MLNRAPYVRRKECLTSGRPSGRRLIAGTLAGVAFAAPFYLVSIGLARSMIYITGQWPEERVESILSHNEVAADWGLPPRPVPVIVGPTRVPTPAWAEPFWAGIAAAFGQAVALAAVFFRPHPPWSHRRKRAGLHARLGATAGVMWVGLVPLLLVKVWFVYVVLLYRGNVWASAFGEPVAADPLVPFVPFGLAGTLLVLFLTLEPWRGLQRAYRCGRWPAVGVGLTAVFAVLLLLAGRWLYPPGAL